MGDGFSLGGLLEELDVGAPQPVVGTVGRDDEAVVRVDCQGGCNERWVDGCQ
jgi:hypothetical protein